VKSPFFFQEFKLEISASRTPLFLLQDEKKKKKEEDRLIELY
jgi:hypothetical protein